jgi:hypothetical protein
MQTCVQIVLIFLSLFTRTGADTQANINITLSVRKLTFSSCIYVLYDGEQGTLCYVLHKSLNELHTVEF